MPVERPNGARVPIGSDPYQLTRDLALLADSLNVIVPVTSAEQRNAYATALAGNHQPGTAVARLDLKGVPIEIWDGSTWNLSRETRHVEYGFSFTATSGVNHSAGGLVFDAPRSTRAGFVSFPGGFLTVSEEDVYAVSMHVNWGGPATDGCFVAFLHPDGETQYTINASTGAGGTSLAAPNVYLKPDTEYPGNRLAIRIFQNTGANRAITGRIRITKFL